MRAAEDAERGVWAPEQAEADQHQRADEEDAARHSDHHH
jgi:hypothetical protein